MSDPVTELARLAEIAKRHGRTSVEAVCRLALAHIAELEAAQLIAAAKRASGGQARAEQLSPARRREIAKDAAVRRWARRAS